MRLTRRATVGLGALPLLLLARPAVQAAGPAVISMRGNADGSKVAFSPRGLLVQPGDTIRWINEDRGNSHTATAFHPSNDDHPLRMPRHARPWNSDYLLPGENFDTVLTEAGTYDYFCIPHEHAGMVARIIVGNPGSPELGDRLAGNPLAEFASVAEIMRQGRVDGAL